MASLGWPQQIDHTLIVGHTKFSPDWCFGLLKREFRRTKVGCLDDIVWVVEKSAKVNHVQLVGTQDGQVLVPTYDWSEFFSSHFRQTALKGIKSLHHLRFSHTHTGSVFVKESVSSPERAIKMLRSDSWSPSKDTLPPVIPPQGLSQERKQYLFEKIREFCPEGCKDLVCPEYMYIVQAEGERERERERESVCATEIDVKYMYIVQAEGEGRRERERKRERNVLRQRDIVHLHLHMQGHVYTNGDCKKDIEKKV